MAYGTKQSFGQQETQQIERGKHEAQAMAINRT